MTINEGISRMQAHQGINKYNDTTLWLLDNKTNKIFEHRLVKEENGHYIIRMPIHKKGRQNTKMRKIK